MRIRDRRSWEFLGALFFAFASFAGFLWFLSHSSAAAQIPASPALELSCPAGSVPLPGGQTVNSATNKYRQWLCVDSNGHVTNQADTNTNSGVAGSNTQIQYNANGAFGASPGFTYNASTGAMTVNPGGLSGSLQVGQAGSGAPTNVTIGGSGTPAAAGSLRLPGGAGGLSTINWLNHAGGADLALGPNVSDQLTWGGNGICISTGTNCPTSTAESVLSWGSNSQGLPTAACTENSTGNTQCLETFLANAHTLTRLTYTLYTAAAGCTTNAVIGLQDVTASTTVSSLTVTITTGFKDSGALSVAMTAGHKYGLWVITAAGGCTTTPSVGGLTAVFQ